MKDWTQEKQSLLRTLYSIYFALAVGVYFVFIHMLIIHVAIPNLLYQYPLTFGDDTNNTIVLIRFCVDFLLCVGALFIVILYCNRPIKPVKDIHSMLAAILLFFFRVVSYEVVYTTILLEIDPNFEERKYTYWCAPPIFLHLLLFIQCVYEIPTEYFPTRYPIVTFIVFTLMNVVCLYMVIHPLVYTTTWKGVLFQIECIGASWGYLHPVYVYQSVKDGRTSVEEASVSQLRFHLLQYLSCISLLGVCLLMGKQDVSLPPM